MKDTCNIFDCGIYPILKKVNSRWLPFILFELETKDKKFLELKNYFEFITPTTLSRSLKKAVDNGFIIKDDDTYSLSDYGKETVKVLRLLEQVEEKYN